MSANTSIVTIGLPRDLLVQLDEKAARERRSRSNLVALLLARSLARSARSNGSLPGAKANTQLSKGEAR